MKCKDAKLVLMDYLFEELDAPQMRSLDNHIESCESCRTEINDLKSTRKILQELQDESASAPSTQPYVRPVNIDQGRYGVLPMWTLKWGIAAAILLFFTLIARPEMTIGKSGFELSFRNQGTGQLDTTLAANFETYKNETIQMMALMLEENTKRNRREALLTYASMAQNLERQRANDLERIDNGFQTIEKNTKLDQVRTNGMILDLINANYTKEK